MVSPVIRLALFAVVGVLVFAGSSYTGLLPDFQTLDSEMRNGSGLASDSGTSDSVSPETASGPPDGVDGSGVDQVEVLVNHQERLDSSDRLVTVTLNQSLGILSARSVVKARIEADSDTKLIQVRNRGNLSLGPNKTIYVDNSTAYTRRETGGPDGDVDVVYRARDFGNVSGALSNPLRGVGPYQTLLQGNYTNYAGRSSNGLYLLRSSEPARARNGTVLDWTSYVAVNSRGVIERGNATFEQEAFGNRTVQSGLNYRSVEKDVSVGRPRWVDQRFGPTDASQ